MANYKLVFKKSVAKDLWSIPSKDVARILQRMEELQENPRWLGVLASDRSLARL